MLPEHIESVLALLAGAPDGPPLNVYTDEVPDNIDIETHPYVRVYFDATYGARHFNGRQQDLLLGITVHSVAGNTIAVAMVSDRVTKALMNVRPAVSGRSCDRIRHDAGTPPDPDESTGQLIYDQTDVFTLKTIPA